MQRMTYKDRASWYTQETTSVEQNEFLKRILEIYQLKYPIIIPCSSGKNLETLSQSSVSVIGYDIDKAMLAMAKEEVVEKGLSNCKVDFGDLLGFYIPHYADSVLILNEAIQLFRTKQEAHRKILVNILCKLNGILILETFDYKNTITKERLRYYCGRELNRIVKDYEIVKDDTSINRYHQALLTKDGVIIKYFYLFKDMWTGQRNWKKSEVELFFFDEDELRQIVEENGGRIETVFSSYTMSLIEDSAKRIYIIRCLGGEKHD